MKWLKWLVPCAASSLLALVAAAAAGWLLGTESGLRWALGFAPRELAIEGARGALVRTISVERVAYRRQRGAPGLFSSSTSSRSLADTISVEFLRAEASR